MQFGKLCLVAAAALALAACEAPGSRDNEEAGTSTLANPFPSTYKPYPSQTLLIANATVLDGAGARIENGSVLIEGGVVSAIGPGQRISHILVTHTHVDHSPGAAVHRVGAGEEPRVESIDQPGHGSRLGLDHLARVLQMGGFSGGHGSQAFYLDG